MESCSGSVLSTPIKKIRNLTIHSPMLTSPIRYPDMNDFPLVDNFINDSMVEKGYSQTLSNAVLRELDTRAQEISSNGAPLVSTSRPMSVSRKRYSGIHKPLFSKMDSISSHYAAARQTDPNRDDVSSSATKKRRTLNGPEDIFLSSQEDPSPTRRKTNMKTGHLNNEDQSKPVNQSVRNFSNDVFSGRLQPLKLHVPLVASSSGDRAPGSPTIPSNASLSSPIKTPGISPSKGSMNLHGLLLDDAGFAKPEGPVRIRPLSLQMAGVKPFDGSKQSLLRKSSNNELSKSRANFDLQKKPSFERLNKKPSTSSLRSANSMNYPHQKPSANNLQKKPSIPNLQNKSSIPSLQKKPSIPNLQKKPSIPSLQKKTSIPNLQKKPSIPTFQNVSKDSHTSTQTQNNFSSLQHGLKLTSHTKFSTLEMLDKNRFLRDKPSRPMSRDFKIPNEHTPHGLFQDVLSRGTKPNVTIPKPFSLYNKPTISSSQKTFESLNSLNSVISNASLQASQRSSNRFQKFKSRFS